MRGLIGLSRDYSFEDFNSSDVQAYLEDKKIPGGKISQILTLWANERSHAIQEIRAYARMSGIQVARYELSNARNYYLISQIYLSDDVSHQTDELLNLLNSYLVDVEYPTGSHFTKERERSITTAINDLRIRIKQELSVGDYHEDTQSTQRKDDAS